MVAAIDMMDLAQRDERWDILGVGYVIKAWGWQELTDLHGEIIIKEAFDQTRLAFDYDSQEFAYQEVQRLLDSAIVYLNKDWKDEYGGQLELWNRDMTKCEAKIAPSATRSRDESRNAPNRLDVPRARAIAPSRKTMFFT